MIESKEQKVSTAPVSYLRPGIETRIDYVAKMIGGRPAAALAAGVSEPMLRRYIRGDSKPPFEVIANLAGAAGVSLDWLASGDMGSPPKSTAAGSLLPKPDIQDGPCSCIDTLGNPVSLHDFVFIPRYNLKASAGHGLDTNGEKPIFSMAFRRYWIDNFLRLDPHDLSVLSVKGDSMEGVLNDRDVILINHADNTPKEGVYVLRIDGDLIVKRVQRKPGGKIGIISANEAYAPYDVELSNLPNDFAIVGRVVWFGRQL